MKTSKATNLKRSFAILLAATLLLGLLPATVLAEEPGPADAEYWLDDDFLTENTNWLGGTPGDVEVDVDWDEDTSTVKLTFTGEIEMGEEGFLTRTDDGTGYVGQYVLGDGDYPLGSPYHGTTGSFCPNPFALNGKPFTLAVLDGAALTGEMSDTLTFNATNTANGVTKEDASFDGATDFISVLLAPGSEAVIMMFNDDSSTKEKYLTVEIDNQLDFVKGGLEFIAEGSQLEANLAYTNAYPSADPDPEVTPALEITAYLSGTSYQKEIPDEFLVDFGVPLPPEATEEPEDLDDDAVFDKDKKALWGDKDYSVAAIPQSLLEAILGTDPADIQIKETNKALEIYRDSGDNAADGLGPVDEDVDGDVRLKGYTGFTVDSDFTFLVSKGGTVTFEFFEDSDDPDDDPAFTTITYVLNSAQVRYDVGAAVAAPAAAPAARTATSITLAAVAAPANGQTVEYARASTNAAPYTGWQDSTAFTGLTANTNYFFFARAKDQGEGKYNVGDASAGTQIKTDAAPVITPSPVPDVTVTFDRNGGTFDKNAVTRKTLKLNSNVGTLPKISRKGHTLKGWYTAKSGGTKISTTTKAAATVTYYAQWTKVKVGKGKTPSKLKNSKKGQLSFSYGKVSGAAGYQVQRATSKNFKKGASKAVGNAKKTKYTFRKLKKNTTVWVRVRAFKKDSQKKNVFGKWSTAKGLKIKR
ncbi:MAG: InlB B-repeat-containing protein [Oscillospiraceae bacterium]|nr:InlB B-repeat-containing protein [Oscillospiraceae bacterium]